jgi:hypothetical protein
MALWGIIDEDKQTTVCSSQEHMDKLKKENTRWSADTKLEAHAETSRYLVLGFISLARAILIALYPLWSDRHYFLSFYLHRSLP